MGGSDPSALYVTECCSVQALKLCCFVYLGTIKVTDEEFLQNSGMFFTDALKVATEDAIHKLKIGTVKTLGNKVSDLSSHIMNLSNDFSRELGNQLVLSLANHLKSYDLSNSTQL